MPREVTTIVTMVVAKPVTPLNIKLSVGRRRLLHIDGKQMSLLAAVSAPHAPLREGRPSSRQTAVSRVGEITAVAEREDQITV